MFTAGTLGDPASTETLIEYWRAMERYHYPGAGERRKSLQARLEREREAAQAAAAQTPTQQGVPGGISDADVEEMARQAAIQDAMNGISQGTP